MRTAFERFYKGGQKPSDAMELAISDARAAKLGEFETALVEYRDERARLIGALQDLIHAAESFDDSTMRESHALHKARAELARAQAQ